MTADTETLTDADHRELWDQYHYVLAATIGMDHTRPYLAQLAKGDRGLGNPMPEPNTLSNYSALYTQFVILQHTFQVFKAELGVLLGLPQLTLELEREWATDESSS